MANIIASLRSCPKSNLKYDRHCIDGTSVKDFLNEVQPKETALNAIYFARQLNGLVNKDTLVNDAEFRSSLSSTFSDIDLQIEEESSEEPNFNNHGIDVELKLNQYQDYFIKERQSKIEQRKELFQQYSEKLLKQSSKLYEQYEDQKIHRQKKKIQEMEAEMKSTFEELRLRQQTLKDVHNQHSKMLNVKLREAARQEKQKEEAAAKRNAEIQEHLTNIHNMQVQMSTVYKQIVEVISTTQSLPEEAKAIIRSLKGICKEMQAIYENARSGKVIPEDTYAAQNLVKKLKEYFIIIEESVNKSKKIVEPENIEKPKNLQQRQADIKPSDSVPVNKEESIKQTDVTGKYIHQTSLKQFIYLNDKLTEKEKSFEILLKDPKLKKYKFDLQKAVNIPVNAIASHSGSHLMDKLLRLTRLLNCQSVEVGNTRVSAGEHSAGVHFCMDLLAKKFVKQGDDQVSSKHESAFAIAAVILGLWKQFPEFGELFLAHLYEKCPYLVPYYIPHQSGQSQEEYLKLQGYNVIDGAIESQDKFLKRMSGITRLYAAVIQSDLPKGMNPPHPHGLEYGWMWLAGILNLDPHPDITATVLYDFLEVCGHSLQLAYRHQFQKLLAFMCRTYFPKLKEVTPHGSSGPISRLELFLQKCIKQGTISPPEGILSSRFWYT